MTEAKVAGKLSKGPATGQNLDPGSLEEPVLWKSRAPKGADRKLAWRKEDGTIFSNGGAHDDADYEQGVGMAQGPKMTLEEHLTTPELRVTALEINPRIREPMIAGVILPVTSAPEPPLTPEDAALLIDMEEYERRLREVGNA